jgi:ammonium transporter, Amt family
LFVNEVIALQSAVLGFQFLNPLLQFAFVIVSMTVVFKAIDLTFGLRVSREAELRGLDVAEHGMESYSGFQIFITE